MKFHDPSLLVRSYFLPASTLALLVLSPSLLIRSQVEELPPGISECRSKLEAIYISQISSDRLDDMLSLHDQFSNAQF